MSNRKTQDKTKTKVSNAKKSVIEIDDSPPNMQKFSPGAIMRFAQKLPVAQRKKFLDTFNTLYIEEE